MGVKSTVQLTRREAIEKFADLKGKSKRRKYEAQATSMDRRELEDKLMELNDAANGGEGFENYIIQED